jgi:hypothetical protein
VKPSRYCEHCFVTEAKAGKAKVCPSKKVGNHTWRPIPPPVDMAAHAAEIAVTNAEGAAARAAGKEIRGGLAWFVASCCTTYPDQHAEIALALEGARAKLVDEIERKKRRKS